MPSVLAIISKAIFERDAKLPAKGGKLAALGDVVPLDRYVSKNKGLTPLEEGGALYLVTVRPPDEEVWLVAILESPSFDGDNWIAAPNVVALTNIASIRDQLKFTSGTGISAKKGALGMSLQTPRVLTDSDVALLRAAGGAAPGGAAAAPIAKREKGHLNAHEPEGPLPCLCHRCFANAPEKITVGALSFVRARADGDGRFLWYWVPESIISDAEAIRRAVESRLLSRRKRGRQPPARGDLDEVLGEGASSDGEGDDDGDDDGDDE